MGSDPGKRLPDAVLFCCNFNQVRSPMAEALMKYETIDAEQIDDIMAGRVPRPPKGWTDGGSAPASGGAQGVESKPAAEQPSPGKGAIGGAAGEH